MHFYIHLVRRFHQNIHPRPTYYVAPTSAGIEWIWKAWRWNVVIAGVVIPRNGTAQILRFFFGEFVAVVMFSSCTLKGDICHRF